MSINPDFVSELRKHFIGEVRLDPGSRILYSTDASIYQIEPLGVGIPHTQEDLHAAVGLAAKHKVPILARGSGSSLAGQAIGEALILDCSRRLDHIIGIDPESRTATVEPGVILAHLNQAAAKHGLQFGPDPASAERATMGGVIANNATGAHSILYGMSADHLLSADVILADGSLAKFGEERIEKGEQRQAGHSLFSALYSSVVEIREKHAEAIKRNYPRSWRNSAGYRLNYLLPWSPSVPPQWIGDRYPPVGDDRVNLAHLLAGSEGTLAVIRRMTVNLVPKPKHTILGVLTYQGIAEACDDVPNILKHDPSAVELIPQMVIRLARGVPEYARQMGWVAGDPSALLVVEFSGDRPEVLSGAVRNLRSDVVVAGSAVEQARVWNVRKVGLGILDSRPQSARPVAFIEDCAIPVEKLGMFVREIERILAEHKTEGGIYAHASAGTLHIRPILDLKTGEGVRSLRSIAEQTLALTLRLGGAMASEHGDGIARGEWLKQTYGDELIAAMRTLKQAADPDRLLNPDKMFDAPPMDSHLRYGVNYQVQTWAPGIDFSRNGGLAVAIEQCNGQGVCRKDSGVMCPSFQATREEQHSTRGRANLLRALISGPWPIGHGRQSMANWPSSMARAAHEALDLCLACKGCKAECPSGVDMAKLKFAFEAEYYKTHRRPLRDYVFGYFHVVAGMLAPVAPIANFFTQNPLTRSITARTMQITSHRPFPKFAERRAKVSRSGNPARAAREKIIFLSDPFARYVDPGVEQASFDLLTILGFDVHLAPVVSAGAALISKGLLDAAKRHADRLLDALKRIDPDNSIPVVGIEPPEIYSLKNDYIDLFPSRADEISRRAANVWLLDEFLLRSKAFNELRVANNSQNNSSEKTVKIKFHPHCHQRAEGLAADGLPNGTRATMEMLRACGYDVELIDAGCCGMAGTFGYEAEHYDLSMRVGELKLFPYIRRLQNEDRKSEIVSTGAACRMQIEQGTGVTAEHPVLLVLRAIQKTPG
jgi:FAD/FMN-containing dehydrogenase/Fe-S oxidoreductase